MDRQSISQDEPCCIEIKYICTGKPLDADMESELEFTAENQQGRMTGGSFKEPYRVVNFCFGKLANAEKFEKYVHKNFSDAQTYITFDIDDF